MNRLLSPALIVSLFAAHTFAADDPELKKWQQQAEAAAVVAVVTTEPQGDYTRLKIVEFWKRKASEAELAKYFGDGYLPAKYPGILQAGQQMVVFYGLPTSRWDGFVELGLGPRMTDGMVEYVYPPEAAANRKITFSEFKKLLANDKEPAPAGPMFCPVKTAR